MVPGEKAIVKRSISSVGSLIPASMGSRERLPIQSKIQNDWIGNIVKHSFIQRWQGFHCIVVDDVGTWYAC